MQKINVLSLFDGISAGQIALNRLNISVDNYYSSEICKHAKKVTNINFPNTIQLGDVRNIQVSELGNIDLLIGGSPCTDLSFGGKMKGIGSNTLEEYLKLKKEGYVFHGQSFLFWEYVRILKESKPKYFLLENVRMKKEIQEIFERELGVKALTINSNLVSAQNRHRLYFTNIDGINQPADKKIYFQDIMEHDVSEKFKVSDKMLNWITREGNNVTCRIVGRRLNSNGVRKDHDKSIPVQQTIEINNDVTKTNCITTVQKDNVILFEIPHGYVKGGERLLQKFPTLRQCSHSNYAIKSSSDFYYRYITPVECERLQTIPDNYTSCISKTQRYKTLGNSWTVDVICHIFKNMEF